MATIHDTDSNDIPTIVGMLRGMGDGEYLFVSCADRGAAERLRADVRFVMADSEKLVTTYPA